MAQKSKSKTFFSLLSIIVITLFMGIFLVLKKESDDDYTDLNLTTIELADTEKERSQGLMNRQELCETCGMLFEFEKEGDLSFWMKNTHIPLDMIFVDEKGEINTIHKNTNPLQTSPTYESDKPAQYVIEVNAGYTEKNEIKTGDYVDIEEIKDKSIDFVWVE